MRSGGLHILDIYKSSKNGLLTCYIECMKSQQCAPLKHHYDECAERVQQQQEENGKADEDCVEECKSRISSERHWKLRELPAISNMALTLHTDKSSSLPPHALRLRLRRPQALPRAQVKHQLQLHLLPATMIPIHRQAKNRQGRDRQLPCSKAGSSYITLDPTRPPNPPV